MNTVSTSPFPTQHQGVERVQAGFKTASDMAQELTHSAGRTKGVAAALLGAVLATLIVLADRAVDAWADDHLFAAWVLLWALIFFVLGLFSGVARRGARSIVRRWQAWRDASAQAQAEQVLWREAHYDPRIMADLRAAILRTENESQAPTAVRQVARKIGDDTQALRERAEYFLGKRAYL